MGPTAIPRLSLGPGHCMERTICYRSCLHVWGPQWKGKKILFHCDNEAIVHVWKHGSSKSKNIMTLLRATYWVAAHYQFNIMMTHVRGCDNIIAASLSRFQMDRFRKAAPGAELAPTPTPANLMRLQPSNYPTTCGILLPHHLEKLTRQDLTHLLGFVANMGLPVFLHPQKQSDSSALTWQKRSNSQH